MTISHSDTIVAQATPPGRGGVGIVRVSGPQALKVAEHILRTPLSPRQATYTDFYNAMGEIIDQGIAIYFKNPHSFTGEGMVTALLLTKARMNAGFK